MFSLIFCSFSTIVLLCSFFIFRYDNYNHHICLVPFIAHGKELWKFFLGRQMFVILPFILFSFPEINNNHNEGCLNEIFQILDFQRLTYRINSRCILWFSVILICECGSDGLKNLIEQIEKKFCIFYQSFTSRTNTKSSRTSKKRRKH